ncbi:MAG: mannose-6-phosphate isomerase, class I [Pseudomonadota bacterium]
MNMICPLENPIMEYAWGSRTAIADLLAKPPSGAPQAEIWMGAHPKSPSKVIWEGRSVSLPLLIEQFPVEILGEPVATRFHNKLPFLFKVLAAGQPLSIQAHPNREQARAGFARENRLGIPIDAADRNYRDESHKPECICALTPFWALRGFRKIADMLPLIKRVCPAGLETELAGLEQSGNEAGLKRFFHTLMTMNEKKRRRIVPEVVSNAAKLTGDPCFEWIIKLHAAYPDDIGILSPALLNLICLKPGEAMFLESGELHAYLCGLGMELMANSDNVLRGGLTPKHVDVEALLSVLNFAEREITLLSPVTVASCEENYVTAAVEFSLSVLTVTAGNRFVSRKKRSVEILFCTQGEARISSGGSGRFLDISKGMSFLVPASSPAYLINGNAIIYKAAVPVPPDDDIEKNCLTNQM